MKEIKSIIAHYKKATSSMQCALATVVYVEGSSYRRVGARMLIFEDGTWIGGISGGCLEGDAKLKAQMVIRNKKSKILTYDTRDEDSESIGIGLGCNGLIDVLISPIDQNANNPIDILDECLQERAEHILITPIECDNKELIGKIYKEEEFEEALDLSESDVSSFREAIEAVKSRSCSKVIELGNCKLLIEFLAPPIHAIIMGGQYDTLALLEINQVLGWKSTLVANPNKMSHRIIELCDQVLDQKKPFKLPNIDRHTVAILMAHDYKTDRNNLERLLQETDIAYIGLLGPKNRKDKMLQEMNMTDPAIINRIYGPVGLDTGATTPEEIAISIVAEIRAFLSQRNGQALRERNEPINDRD